MDERWDNWNLTEQEKEFFNFLITKRRLAKSRAEYMRRAKDSEPEYCEEPQQPW